MIRWYDGVDPATAIVRCGGAPHRVTWRKGRVVLEDHDPAAEAALAGLGGGSCACLEVLQACRAGFGVDDLFGLWTEQGEPVGATHAFERWARRVGAPPVPTGRTARLAAERRAAVVASLPLAFRRRLALGVFQAIAREPDGRSSGSHPGFEPVFSSVLTRSAAASLPAAWAGLPVDQRWTLIGPAGAAAVEGRLGAHGGWVRMAVSAGWVAEVWAWDLARVDGHLVLEVVDRPSRAAADVRLVRWSAAGQPRLVTASAVRSPGPSGGSGGRWRLGGT